MSASPTPECPSLAVLEQFLVDPCQADPGLEIHLDTCLRCRERLDDLWQDSTLGNWFDRARISPPTAEGLAFLERMRQARPASKTTANAATVQPSQRLGAYRIERPVGAGAMGTVYRARDTRLGRPVALKLLHNMATGARFQREAEVLAALAHPNIMPIFELGEHEGQRFLVMEYAAGGTLKDWVAGRPQPPAVAAQVLAILARAVQFAHDKGVVHRDLKPSNILLQPLGLSDPDHEPTGPLPLSGYRLLVADFGLARWRQDDKDLTDPGQPVGTPCYMAPEQARGAEDAGAPAIDLYALGVLLYELLSGHPPFRGVDVASTLRQIAEQEPVSPRLLHPGVPRDLETITLKCLEKEPRRRYPTAAALAEDLERFLNHQPITARPVGPVGRLSRWAHRQPAVAALSGLAAALALAVVAGSIQYGLEQRRLRALAEGYRRTAEGESNRAGHRHSELMTMLGIVQHEHERFNQVIQRGILLFHETADQWDRLGPEPAPSPAVLALRNHWSRGTADWCEAILGRRDPGGGWTPIELQTASLLVRLRTQLGELDAARTLALEARAGADRLVDAQPMEQSPREQALMLRLRLGQVHQQAGAAGEAEACLTEVDREAAARLVLHPEASAIRWMRIASLSTLAQLRQEQGRAAEAVEPLRASLACLPPLIQGPDAIPARREQAWTCERLGRLLLQLDRPEEARAAFDEALEFLGTLPAESQAEPELIALRQNCLEQRARSQSAASDTDPREP